ncbi:MAG: hypothetical protein IPL65_08560 [Lewinellaceae bacterium]|nr:hypothetical protein [Lewinellaceae bacterium]
MKTSRSSTFLVPFFLLLLLGSCKKDKDPIAPVYPFEALTHIPADESIRSFIARPGGKMLALTTRGTVLVLDTLQRDSLNIPAGYAVYVMCAAGDTLFSMALLGSEIHILQYDLLTEQILVDELAPSQTLVPNGILRTNNGYLYLSFYKGFSILVPGYSDVYRRGPAGVWDKFRITKKSSNLFNLGGTVSGVVQDANGSVWLGTASRGLGEVLSDTIIYHAILTQQNTNVEYLISAPNGSLYLEINNTPYKFSNNVYTDMSNPDPSYFGTLSTAGIFRKSSGVYFVYDQEIYLQSGNGGATHYRLKNLVGESSPSNGIECAESSTDNKVWMYLKNKGVYVSGKI